MSSFSIRATTVLAVIGASVHVAAAGTISNALTLNGIHLNGIHLNGIHLNGSSDAGVASRSDEQRRVDTNSLSTLWVELPASEQRLATQTEE